MPNDSGTTSFNGKAESSEGMRMGRSRVLLREPERCCECNKVYVALYPLRSCAEHEGFDEL